MYDLVSLRDPQIRRGRLVRSKVGPPSFVSGLLLYYVKETWRPVHDGGSKVSGCLA